MGWIVRLVVAGLVIGAMGRLVLPGRQHVGLLGTVAAGIAGSVLGAVLAAVVPFFDHRELSGLVFNVAGAALVLAGYERLARRRA